MRILLVGGGSGGPVAPLIAVAEEIKTTHPRAEFLLVGTKNGPEKILARNRGILFQHVSAGKFRRYFSWKNLLSPVFSAVGFFQALKILKKFKPDCVFGAGSFVQVPVIWAAWFRRVPVVLHQQDVVPSLANRLCQLAAKKITVVFESSLADFSDNLGFFYHRRPDKTALTGNPFRRDLAFGSREKALGEFGLKPDLPVLLVLGGGTGADFLNRLITNSLPELLKTVQIIHSTGLGKVSGPPRENYHPYEFISNMADAYAAADIVLSRAGLSTLTELSHLKKLSIIVALPNTHQEMNAWMLMKMQAAIVLEQQKITSAGLVRLIRKLLFEHEAQTVLKTNIGKIMPKDANKKIAEIIIKTASSSW